MYFHGMLGAGTARIVFAAAAVAAAVVGALSCTSIIRRRGMLTLSAIP
jgi:hypothetical protein